MTAKQRRMLHVHVVMCSLKHVRFRWPTWTYSVDSCTETRRGETRGYGNTYHGFLAQTELIYAGVLDLHSATNTYKRAPDSGFLFIEMVRNEHVKIL